MAIILLTLLIKFALYPLAQQSIKSQKALQDLQPKIDEIKLKYKDDKEGLSKAMMSVYKDNKVNPFSSCLPLLVQLPFLIAIFQVLSKGLNDSGSLYSFIKAPENINYIFLGIADLSKPNIILAVLSGAAQFWQSKMMITKKPEIKSEGSKDEEFASIMNKQMLYMMPVITVLIGMKLPGGLALYWLASTLFTVFQQRLVFRKKAASIQIDK